MPTPITTLMGHIPALIAQRFAENPSLFIEPVIQACPAAILAIDVSSLANLANRIVEKGPAGSDELTELLKTHFKELTNILTDHGGDVVKFTSDRMFVLWATQTSNESMDAATLRAAQCAFVLNSTIHNRSIVDDLTLSLKMSIDEGDVLTTDLGGVYGRWEFLATGSPVIQVQTGLTQANDGEILISSNAWTRIESQCTGQPVENDFIQLASITSASEPAPLQLPSLTSQAEAALRGYIPGAFLARLGAIQTSMSAELLPLTVLFINLPDLTYTASIDQTQTVMRALQTILYDYEGSVDKIRMDNTGTSLVAALGLPPVAHDNDAILGVQAALAMQTELEELEIRGVIGIATGWAFCGLIGNDIRHEYTIIGNSVDLAEKLMQSAREVLITESQTDHKVVIRCDHTTYEASQAEITFETLDPIVIDPQIDAIEVYEPIVDLSQANQPQMPSSDSWLDSEMLEEFQ